MDMTRKSVRRFLDLGAKKGIGKWEHGDRRSRGVFACSGRARELGDAGSRRAGYGGCLQSFRESQG